MIRKSVIKLLFCSWAIAVAGATDQNADDSSNKSPVTIELAKGRIKLTAPADWKRKPPRSRLLQYEFAAPAGKKGLTDGRFTVSTIGGSVKANLQRWVGQFAKKAAPPKIKERKIGDYKVHIVDIAGTYLDARGPAFPAVRRDNYRLLGAIIETKDAGQHFLKFYGPKEVIDKHAKAFQDMVDSLNREKSNEESETDRAAE